MPSLFTTLTPEIHVNIASYLSGEENKNVSQTCISVRSIYQIESWKNCHVSLDGESFSYFQESYQYRACSKDMVQYPEKYKSWFKTKSIENLMFDEKFLKSFSDPYGKKNARTEAFFKRSNIEFFTSLERMAFAFWGPGNLIDELQKDVLPYMRKIEISGTAFGYNLNYDSTSDFSYLSEVCFKPLDSSELDSLDTLSPQNLTRLKITDCDLNLVENAVSYLYKVDLPHFRDLTLELSVCFDDSDTTMLFSAYDLEKLSDLDDAPFMSKLKYFQLNFVAKEDDYSAPSYYFYQLFGNLIVGMDTRIPIISFPYATHLSFEPSTKPVYTDTIRRVFNFPNVTHAYHFRIGYDEKLNSKAIWNSLSSSLSYLSIGVDLPFKPDDNNTQTVNYLGSLKSLVKLKTFHIDVTSDWEFKQYLCVRSLGEFHGTMEGSIFFQISKILQEVRKFYSENNFADVNEMISKLKNIICTEFPYIIPLPGKGGEARFYYETMPDYTLLSGQDKYPNYDPRLRNSLFEKEVRGFFISWLLTLIINPWDFLSYFPKAYNKMFEAQGDFDLRKKTFISQQYGDIGGIYGPKIYKNWCCVYTLLEFLYNTAIFDCFFECLSHFDELEYFQVGTENDLMPSHRLGAFIQNSQSIKQIYIDSYLHQPFGGCHKYISVSSLLDHIGPYIDKRVQYLFEINYSKCALTETIADINDAISKYKFDLYSTPGKNNDAIGIESFDLDFFLPAPANGKREVLLSGIMKECSDEARLGRKFSGRSSSRNTHARVFYSLNNDACSINVSDIEKSVDAMDVLSCFERRLTFNGWF